MKDPRNTGRCVVVHGGAGKLRPDSEKKIPFLRQAVDAAWDALERGLPGEDAVVQALRVMEGCEYFNAGYGGYPNSQGIVLLDIGLMRGTREFVSLVNVRRLRYPSEAALDLLRQGKLMISVWTHEHMQEIESAPEEVRLRYGLVPHHDDLVSPYVRELIRARQSELEADKGKGTVGCIVRDRGGKLFAGTSTGGINFKANGRIGDTPVIGAGVYADDSIGALSTSGHGESALATCFSGMLLGELRRANRNSHHPFAESGVLAEIIRAELSDFAVRAPGRCLGAIVCPPHGRPEFGVHGGTFAVGIREEHSKTTAGLFGPEGLGAVKERSGWRQLLPTRWR